MHGDLCKHLGIDSSTDHPDRHSNLFLNAYINHHVNAEYLKMTYTFTSLFCFMGMYLCSSLFLTVLLVGSVICDGGIYRGSYTIAHVLLNLLN